VIILKGKQKISLPIIVVVIAIIAISMVWYFSPKIFLRGVEPSDVKSISVFDGNTGKLFVIDDVAEIKYIVENIQDIEMQRGNLSVGYSGFRFQMNFNNSNGETIDSFVINSADSIRDDPFFYRCNGGLCFEYIEGIENKYVE